MAKKMSMEKYIKVLRNINNKLIPTAINMTLNFTAFDVRETAQFIIPTRMTVRQKSTINKVIVNKASLRSPIARMEARAGTILPYMERQEVGGTIRASRRKIAIPTDKSRIGDDRGRKIRRNLKLNTMGQLRRGGTKGKPFFANLNRKGIYIRRGRRLLMLRSLEKTSVTIRASHWLSDSVDRRAGRQDFERRFNASAKRLLAKV